MELRIDSSTTVLPPSFSPSASVLVLSPCLHEDSDVVCTDLLGVTDPDKLRILVIDVTASPLRVQRRIAQSTTGEPTSLEVIGVEYMKPTEQVAADVDRQASIPDAHTTYVEEPGDLNSLRAAASKLLREWANTDEQVVVCFRSLTTILQYTDDGSALAFLRELLRHCETADALVHIHLDPTAIDDQAIEGAREHADTVIELDVH